MDGEYLLSGFHSTRTKGCGLFERSHVDSLPAARMGAPAEVRVGLHKSLDVILQELLSHLSGNHSLYYLL